MGILSRMKTALKSKANSSIDRASNPAKELDRAIAELEETHREAMKELLSYKTTAKRMAQDVARYDEERALWDQRARAAVKKGDDELAKKCLREKSRCDTERAAIQRDSDEAAGYAAELNNSRKQAETRLKMLKMRKGTMASQIASARSGGSSTFGNESELFDRLDKAGERIDEGTVAAEVEAAMAGDELDAGTRMSDLEQSSVDSQSDDALAELKARMGATKRGS